MKVVIFEGPRGSGKSSLIEDARNYLTKKGNYVECYFLPGTTEATKQMRQLALKDSTVSMLSRRLIQIAAGLDDHLNMENIIAQSGADYIFFDRSSHISNFVYGAMAGYSEDEISLSQRTGYLYNELNGRVSDLSYVFVYANTDTCLKRIKTRTKEKDYLDLDLDETRERNLNDAYLGLFMTLNDQAADLYASELRSSKQPETELQVGNWTLSDIQTRALSYTMDIEFYKKNSLFLVNESTRKRALSNLMFHLGVY